MSAVFKTNLLRVVHYNRTIIFIFFHTDYSPEFERVKVGFHFLSNRKKKELL